MGWGFLIGLAIVVAVVGRIGLRAMQFKHLAHDGVAASGVVVKKFREGAAAGRHEPYLRYEYRVDGKCFENKIATLEEFWDAHEEGDSIEIVYVPSKPSVSAARYLVNESRKALNLPLL